MNPLLKLTLAAALALSSASFTPAHAAQPVPDSAQAAGTTESAGSSGASRSTGSDQTSGSTTSMSEGEIKKVDKEAGKVTIKHGPLTNLDMPAMTMNFKVKDATMLDQVKPGDKVRFVADKVAGAFTVIQLENVN
ncbi:MAG: copper-binding protein [Herminiimonas sp.]|nr:copper-binding protein [Herminiimonas sp.]